MVDTSRHTLTHPSGKFEITVEGAARRDTFVSRGYSRTPLPETETQSVVVRPPPQPVAAKPKPWMPSTAKAAKPK